VKKLKIKNYKKNKRKPKFDQNLTVNCNPFFKELLMEFYKDKEVVEIGPGKGFYSSILRTVSSKLELIQIDSKFSKELIKDNYSVLNIDFKKWILEEESFKENLKKTYTLFSSLPYSQLKFLFSCNLFFEGYFIAPNYILQKKGCFSNYLRYCYEIKVISKIPNQYFSPEPSLSSSYLYIKKRINFSYSLFKKTFNKSLGVLGKITSNEKLKRKRLHQLTVEEISEILKDKN